MTNHRLINLRKASAGCSCGATYAGENLRGQHAAHKTTGVMNQSVTNITPRSTSAKGTTFRVETPDGTVLERTSKTHEYNYCVAVGPCEGHDGWGVYGWSSRADLAEKVAAKAQIAWAKEGAEVLVIPVAA